MPKTKRELDREIKEIIETPPALKLPGARQHSSIAREPAIFNTADLRVGQRFDHFGHIYEILKIARDKERTVQIARRVPDSFGKEAFIDHRSFPARHFDQQHLRPIPSHATIKTFDAPKPSLTVRQINAIVRASDGRNVYLIRNRLDTETIQRVIRARTKGRETEVRSLATGNWLPVLPERGDRLEVR